MTEKDLKTIWQVPKYLPYVQPSLTDDVIAEAEKQIGYNLPKEYIALLKIQNGGYIRFTIENTVHRQIAGIGPYFPSITDFEWLNDYDDLSYDTKDLFPFDGDGHWNICLDYRKNKINPEITYIDTESDYEKLIATTFSDYLNLLEINIEDEYVIETDLSIDELLNKISKITNIEFEAPDIWSHGYPLYRAEFKDSYVFISSNNAPTGFVREEDARYDELKSLMNSTALRFPELSENAFLINVLDEHEREILFDKLISNGLKIRGLSEFI